MYNLHYVPTTLGVQSWREIISGGTRTKKVEYHWDRPCFRPTWNTDSLHGFWNVEKNVINKFLNYFANMNLIFDKFNLCDGEVERQIWWTSLSPHLPDPDSSNLFINWYRNVSTYRLGATTLISPPVWFFFKTLSKLRSSNEFYNVSYGTLWSLLPFKITHTVSFIGIVWTVCS
jgi:hypothetical protein